MKALTQLRITFSLILITLVTSTNVFAITYTSMNNGNWNDVINVWSTDGGVTPCGCSPGSTSAGNNIVINNNLTMSYNLIFNAGSNVIISPTGTLSGPFNINMWNANADIFGNISIAKWTQDFSTNVTLHAGVSMSLTNRFVMADGNFTNDGGFISCGGNFDLSSPAHFSVINAGKVYLSSGNITNYGVVFIDAASCMTANGNWKNGATGTVSGSGSATTEIGNIQNLGVWDVNLKWCSAGSDSGMPSPEDCATATAVCNGIALPVELVDFAAAYNNGDVLITWTTVSETNNDHFIVMRSVDGKIWNEIAQVKGAGTTTETRDYQVTDNDIDAGVYYYQLIQVDMDGRENPSEVISISVRSVGVELQVYPNPVGSSDQIHIRNIGEENGTISVMNTRGSVLTRVSIDPMSVEAVIDLPDLSPGIYLIAVEQSGEIRTAKLIVR